MRKVMGSTYGHTKSLILVIMRNKLWMLI